MNITIVTPWYEHLELAGDYFEAVLPELQTGDRNLVIDNHSNPPLPFAAYEFSFNAGFSRACNLGLKRAKTDAVLFLNNDIALGEPGWLEMYREALEPGVLCGPLRYGHHADVNGIQLPYIDGWCLAGMKKDLMELGGFDQSLREPAYYSDNLLCLSAREHGMRLRDVRVPLRAQGERHRRILCRIPSLRVRLPTTEPSTSLERSPFSKRRNPRRR